MNDAANIPLWPQERLGDALQAVARALGLPAPAVPGPTRGSRPRSWS